MGTFSLAKKDVSREKKIRWRDKKEVAEQPRRKELSMVGVGGYSMQALATSAAGEKPKNRHHGHHKLLMRLLQFKPNAPVHNVQ